MQHLKFQKNAMHLCFRWETRSLSSLRITYNLPLISLLIITKKSLREGRVAANIQNLDAGSDWLLQSYRHTI